MIESICQWLAATALSRYLASVEFFVPLVQTIHILAVAGVLAALAFVDVKVIRGAVPDGPALAARFAPQVKAALWTLLVTGLLLTLIEPARELLNSAFRIKVLLLLPLLLLSTAATLARLRAGTRPSPALAAANLALLVGIVGCGRFIAYI